MNSFYLVLSATFSGHVHKELIEQVWAQRLGEAIRQVVTRYDMFQSDCSYLYVIVDYTVAHIDML